VEEKRLSVIDGTGVNGVMQTEIYTAEPLVLGLGAFVCVMAVEVLERYRNTPWTT
jgi:hypothetical protein